MRTNNMKAKKIIALFLAATILFTLQGTPVMAETADGTAYEAETANETAHEEEAADGDGAENIDENTETVDVNAIENVEENAGIAETGAAENVEENMGTVEADDIENADVNTGTENTAAIKGAGQEMPENPVHHCTTTAAGDYPYSGDSDTTMWSYVYFGSYPQTEVTGNALTAAITGASYDANGDTWVNGTKYRRISKSDTNDDSYFGNSAYRYFKWERIKWRVLQNDGNTLFVAADKGLDCKCYNDTRMSVTWENCTLRNWLNKDFYGMAFSNGEQGVIVEQTVVNEDPYGREGGNDTRDKVYLLSLSESMNPDYGFCENHMGSASRRVKTSDYAHARGYV